ncbi:MAG: hypothetical protein NT013_20550 [Planctomycetia bacterium]|nr:hypothetical protein [Planctomycetia bacterium]
MTGCEAKWAKSIDQRMNGKATGPGVGCVYELGCSFPLSQVVIIGDAGNTLLPNRHGIEWPYGMLGPNESHSCL